MGEKKEHLKNLSRLSEKIIVLANSIQKAERDMQATWIDEIEARDLQNVKERMKAVEDTLCMLKEEVGHIKGKHCKRG
jgi:hypothetical protein